ncbi:hypothetical protein FNF28_01998 [Cafeteria roenbergensis]|uniref:Uncharacterized protein n=1 Tax=Cafeteria roenbergensis TaxID=33653 RepID=A0A5A8DY04_CAFRO|nr:hypothetical protein FNF28_01998 [Cafeteria roenbergensis]
MPRRGGRSKRSGDGESDAAISLDDSSSDDDFVVSSTAAESSGGAGGASRSLKRSVGKPSTSPEKRAPKRRLSAASEGPSAAAAPAAADGGADEIGLPDDARDDVDDLGGERIIVPADAPPELLLDLLPFQREGLGWMVRQEHSAFRGGILADEMGMGKTIQTISLIIKNRHDQLCAPTDGPQIYESRGVLKQRADAEKAKAKEEREAKRARAKAEREKLKAKRERAKRRKQRLARGEEVSSESDSESSEEADESAAGSAESAAGGVQGELAQRVEARVGSDQAAPGTSKPLRIGLGRRGGAAAAAAAAPSLSQQSTSHPLEDPVQAATTAALRSAAGPVLTKFGLDPAAPAVYAYQSRVATLEDVASSVRTEKQAEEAAREAREKGRAAAKRQGAESAHKPVVPRLALRAPTGPASHCTLVVCPVVAIAHWRKEIEKHTKPGTLKVLVHHGATRTTDPAVLLAADVVITSYSIVEAEFRRMIAPSKVRCDYCGKLFMPEKLRFHLKYFCGPDAVLTEAQRKQERGEGGEMKGWMRRALAQRGGGGPKGGRPSPGAGKGAGSGAAKGKGKWAGKGRGSSAGAGGKHAAARLAAALGEDEGDSDAGDSARDGEHESEEDATTWTGAEGTAGRSRRPTGGRGESKGKPSSSKGAAAKAKTPGASGKASPGGGRAARSPLRKAAAAGRSGARRAAAALAGGDASDGDDDDVFAPDSDDDDDDDDDDEDDDGDGNDDDDDEGADDDDDGDCDDEDDDDDDGSDAGSVGASEKSSSTAGRKGSGKSGKPPSLGPVSPLQQIYWRRVVLDEAHAIKNLASATARAVLSLTAERRWCLSGTPLQNRAGELNALVRFLRTDPFAFYFCTGCPCKSPDYSFRGGVSKCPHCGCSALKHYSWLGRYVTNPICYRPGTPAAAEAMHRLRAKVLPSVLLRRTKAGRSGDMALPCRLVRLRKDAMDRYEEDFYSALYTQSQAQFGRYAEKGTVLNNYAHIFGLLLRLRQAVDHPFLVLYSQGASSQAAGSAAAAAAESASGACSLCGEAAEDAVPAKCGHLFCRACVVSYLDAFDSGDKVDEAQVSGDEAEDGSGDVAASPSAKRPRAAGAGSSAAKAAQCPACMAPLTVDLTASAGLSSAAQGGASKGILSRVPPHQLGSGFRSSTKIEALLQELTLAQQEEPGCKSIVFSQFTSMLDLVEHRLTHAGVRCVKLDGRMSLPARDRIIQAFDSDPSVLVFLISLKAGGVALNLTAASRTFLLDPWWNPAAEEQALDRTHRLGQHRPITAVRLVIAGSIEERILKLQEKKKLVFEGTIGKDSQALARLTEADMRFLFSG